MSKKPKRNPSKGSSKKNKLKPKLKSDILNVINANPSKTFNYKQISSLLEISDKNERKLIFDILTEMAKSGEIKELQRGKYRSSGHQTNLIEGVIEKTRSGDGYLIADNFDEDIFIDEKNMNKALHGDRVKVKIIGSKRKKIEGKIVEVQSAVGKMVVGNLEVQENYAFLLPDDQRMAVDIFIPKSKLKDGRDGDKALVKITDWPDSAKNPFGEVVDIFGSPGTSDAEMKGILTAYGIPIEFPREVMEEASDVSMDLDPAEIEKREDFRDVLTFTIDPVDAKDFDDALSIEYLKNDVVRVGVHIADVGHYINLGSELDKEARERGNSVYLVDRVVPMLPEHLSNGVCSLRPNEEKFVFSAVFELSPDGEIIKEHFTKAVIKSDRRFAYEEAQEAIETGKGVYAKEINTLDKLAKIMRKQRMANGALEIGGSEIRFELDKDQNPIQVHKKISKDANKLIEEFMLLANRRVGTFIGDVKRKKVVPFIYRIHDKPDMEKIGMFKLFVSKFDKSFNPKNENDIAPQMNALFARLKGESELATVQQMAIKSMAKAVYDTENIGHYGLGFRYYAHFTSPIRRYADLWVHRILLNELNKKNHHYPRLKETADHISVTERRAAEAERASKKYFQAKFLEDKEGETFKGVITGLTEWGIYVELEENYCEGMVPLKSLKWDRFEFDSKHYVVAGRKTGEEFNLGDHVWVKVVKVSLVRKQIDLELVD